MPAKRLTDDRLTEIINETGRMVASAPYSTSSAVVFDLALELQEYRAATVYYVDPEKVVPERKPSDIEVIAERLAKVEDRLASTPTLDGVNRELKESFRRIDQRIDKVAEIIGERVSDLVNDIAELRSEVQRAHNRFDGWQEPVFPFDDIAAVRDSAKRAHERVDSLEGPSSWLDNMQATINWLTEQVETLNPGVRAPAFPTGGAHTAEAAAEAVLPVPQRGDRVRLEDAKTLANYAVPDGWHEVVGQSGDAFQVRLPQIGGDWLPYIPNETTGLKEVKANGTPR